MRFRPGAGLRAAAARAPARSIALIADEAMRLVRELQALHSSSAHAPAVASSSTFEIDQKTLSICVRMIIVTLDLCPSHTDVQRFTDTHALDKSTPAARDVTRPDNCRNKPRKLSNLPKPI